MRTLYRPIIQIHRQALFSILLIVLAAIAIPLISWPKTVSAVTTGFDPGQIISDTVFYNTSTMSVQDIQNFLNAKVPSCDSSHSGYTGQTGTTYNPPWVCLKDYYENPNSTYTISYTYQDTSGAAQTGSRTYYYNNAYQYTSLTPVYRNGDYRQGITGLSATINSLGGAIPSGAISTAQIIYNVAQQYGINPQVLLVLLQKEQGLVTDTWPTPWQYQAATGYGCPDTAPCSSTFAGFSRQLSSAAWQFQQYRANPGGFNYVAGRNNTILYNPNSACGSSTVFIQNQATAGLYNYTPYQPNNYALNGGTSSAYPNCGAFGNLNFFSYFTSWFGNPLGPDYQASFYAQSNYITSPTNTTKTVYFMFKNTGRLPWGDDISAAGFNPVHLATDNPINRSSAFSNSSWLSSNRPSGQFSAVYKSDGTTLSTDQHVVNPGEIAKFSFTLSIGAGIIPANYDESFILVREGASDWALSGSNVWTRVAVQPTYGIELLSQPSPLSIAANEQTASSVLYRNTGNVALYDDASVPAGSFPLHLATTGAINRSSVFGQSWATTNRPNGTFSAVYETDGTTPAANQHVAQPGQVVKYTFNITAPVYLNSGTYNEQFQPILEGAQNWDLGAVSNLNITVAQSPRTASYYAQSQYPTIRRGTSGTVYFIFKNTGQTTWYDDASANRGVYPLHLATSAPVNRNSQFANASWVSPNRPTGVLNAVYESDGVTLAATQHQVKPGQLGKFSFTITAPTSMQPGFYQENYQPIIEAAPGDSWSIDGKVWIGVTVTN